MDIKGAYFLWGEENYLIDQEIRKITEAIEEKHGEKPELVYIDGDEVNAEQLISMLDFSPLFAFSRVVVIKRPAWLKKNQRSKGAVNDVKIVLERYFENMPQGQVLIVTSLEHPSGNPVVKLLDKECTVIQCRKAGEPFLRKWIQEEIKVRHLKATPQAVNFLVKSGLDMYSLVNVLDKLSLGDQEGSLQDKDLRSQIETRDEVKVFKFIDALLVRDTRKALQVFHQLLAQGEHPLFMLYMVGRQFSVLGQVKYLQEKGRSMGEIVKSTGQKEFTIKKMVDKTRNFTWEEVHQVFTDLLDTDIKLKTSSVDNVLVVESLIYRICR